MRGSLTLENKRKSAKAMGKDTRGGSKREVVEETETGESSIQFNFLRNSLVFEIQPPKGMRVRLDMWWRWWMRSQWGIEDG